MKSHPPLSLSDLFSLTHEKLGISAADCADSDWRSVSSSLVIELNRWAGLICQDAQRMLNQDLHERLNLVPYGSDQRSIYVGGGTLRPPDSFFVRPDQPWDNIPQIGQGGDLYIRIELSGARPSSIPDHYLSPAIYLSFHVGYRACEPLKWLVKNWRRPLEKLLLPLKADVDFNGFENPNLKAFRGKDSVRKTELYLEEPGPDPVVSWHLTFHDRSKEAEVARALAIFLAIYDAIYSLQIQRCDPDRLFRNFLSLQPHLENLPFRGGFYDPGLTKKQLIEDWNRRNPDDALPLDAKW